jgi:hypothetical protein
MRIASLLLVIQVAACGSPSRPDVDAGDDSDGPPVDADMAPMPIGDVAGETITPTVFYFGRSGGGFDQVALKEGGVACQPGADRHAVLITFPCGPIAVGSYQFGIGTECTSPRAYLNVTGFAFPYTELYSLQGVVEITATTPTVQGYFTATQFYNPSDLVSAPGAIGGTFDVAICP